jgi:hypothetical protein
MCCVWGAVRMRISGAFSRLRRMQALDVATAVVLAAAVFFFVGPGSALNAAGHHRLALYHTGQAAKRHWETLAMVAQPIYEGPGAPQIIEFSDYECPFCRASAASVDSVVRLGFRVAIVHYPLVIHSHARPAAIAAICAGKVGRFREAHRFLLASTAWQSETSPTLSPQVIDSSVSGKFSACVASHEAEDILASHLALADTLRVLGTPMFISARGVLTDPPSTATIMSLAGR